MSVECEPRPLAAYRVGGDVSAWQPQAGAYNESASSSSVLPEFSHFEHSLNFNSPNLSMVRLCLAVCALCCTHVPALR